MVERDKYDLNALTSCLSIMYRTPRSSSGAICGKLGGKKQQFNIGQSFLAVTMTVWKERAYEIVRFPPPPHIIINM